MCALDWKIYDFRLIDPRYGALVHARVALDYLLNDEKFDRIEDRFLNEFGTSAYSLLSKTLNCFTDSKDCDESNLLVATKSEGVISLKVTNKSGLDVYVLDSIPSMAVDDDAGVLLMATKQIDDKDLFNAFVRVDGRRRFYLV